MEIFNLYQSITQIFLQIVKIDVTRSFTLGLILGVGVYVILFILQGFGLYAMAEKRNMPKKWLAFIPFANMLYIEKLSGEYKVFGRKVKRMGLYTMLAAIVAFVFCALTIAAEMYLFLQHGEHIRVDEYGYMIFTGEGFALKVARFYDISMFFIMIVGLVYEILLYILMLGLYKKYSAKNHMLFGILCLFAPLSRFIVVFCIRKNKAIDYEAYMRAQREAFMRQQQQRYQNMYGNPYNNPYGNPYNPYGNPYGSQSQQQSQPKNEDPFEEFSSNDSNASSENKDEDRTNAQGGSEDFFS